MTAFEPTQNNLATLQVCFPNNLEQQSQSFFLSLLFLVPVQYFSVSCIFCIFLDNFHLPFWFQSDAVHEMRLKTYVLQHFFQIGRGHRVE